ncbi:ArsR/SmtB family transcription factor [Flavimaricola marinus]|uniref:Transcriptional repressor SdpR n=1 Tax=Flavimaricola marinus TaxID=1819565 RepID=A0A238LIG4_9RHOB|nr:helix-turn-helix domain-containing protein [Flavimaricola marinus]SMY09479.1 Transcriptional repressor SdpR [Flavimaricola marinus]
MDAVFKALNDPARRALLDSLRGKDGQTLTELEEQLNMTRFGVMKHLKVLEDAHLIIPRKVGRFKHHYLNVVPLAEVMDRWIEPLLARPAARAMIDLKTKLELPDMTKPDFMMQTYIKCSQDALWEALTSAEAAPNFHFMAERVERDGNALVYYVAGGNVMLICTETTLTPKTRIESTFEPKWAGPDVPMATSRFVYQIEPQGDFCQLTLEHYDVPAEQTGVLDGWSRILSGLKTYLETGQPANFGGPAQ